MRIDRGDDPGPYSRYGEYKPDLRRVFRGRCAYCMTPDHCLGGMEAMTVDHFLPRDRFGHLLTVWTNLYYACSVCNEHYKKNRPTAAEEAAGLGFIDPCVDDPDEHFWLVSEAKTGQFCKVRARTHRARFPMKVLQLNYRAFLREFWRELDLRDASERAQLKDVEKLLGKVRRRLRGARPDEGDELKAMLRYLEERRALIRETLVAIAGKRPFPMKGD